MSDPQTPHPLDEALRRQLGPYGEAPSPRVWAGVRRNLPGAVAPHRRWRRRLPVLLLLLLPMLAGTWLLVRPPNSGFGQRRPLAEIGQRRAGGRAATGAGRPAERPRFGPGQDSGRASASLPPLRRPSPAPPLPAGVAAANSRARPGGRPTVPENRTESAIQLADSRKLELPRQRSSPARFAGGSDATIAYQRRKATPQLRHPESGGATTLAGRAAGSPKQAARASFPAEDDSPDFARLPATPPGTRAGRRPQSPATAAAEPAVAAPTIMASQLLLTINNASPPLPSPLALRPDSAAPTPAGKRHRWAVQAGAGPSLSYRRLPPPSAGGPSDVAQLERPGLGWGAQVQGRRVLSGRWALAVGLGYQQYATRLDPPQQAGSNAPSAFLGNKSAAASPVRDTYNVLTMPVQLIYALGAAGPRWQVAALGGVEPGRYLGGRSTGDSAASYDANANNLPATSVPPTSTTVAFGQRSYASAAASPYRAWNLSLSLGLDLRYRLAPAGRWQLLVQPTGRYVVSPFARAAAADYSRQPFSLGVLMGLSWDVR